MKTSTGSCNRCKGDVYHDGERWRHAATHLPLDQCPTVVNPDTALLAEHLKAAYAEVMHDRVPYLDEKAFDAAWYRVAERAKELRA